VDKSFDDKDFVKSLMLKMAENWDKIEKKGKDVMFFLSEKDHEKLGDELKKKAAQVIKGGIDIDFEEGIKSGFRLGPKDGSYKLSFTDEDFHRFFAQYLRPRTRKFFTED
jgi:V/A-type H+-transporting ATPase subunit E